MMAILLAGACAVLSGCRDQTPEGKAPTFEGTGTADAFPESLSRCGLDQVGLAVGQPDTARTRDGVRQRLPGTSIRWIHPGEIVSQDFDAERLNVIVDETGKIVAIRCG